MPINPTWDETPDVAPAWDDTIEIPKFEATRPIVLPIPDSLRASAVDSIRANRQRQSDLGQPRAEVQPNGEVLQRPLVDDSEANQSAFAKGKEIPAQVMHGVGTVAAALANYPVELWRADTGTPRTTVTTFDKNGQPGLSEQDKPLPFAAGQPVIQLHTPTVMQPNGNDFSRLLEGFLTPDNLALFPFGASKIVQAAFLTQTVPEVVNAATKLVDPKLSRSEKQSAATDALINTVFSYGLAHHLANGGEPVMSKEQADANNTSPTPGIVQKTAFVNPPKFEDTTPLPQNPIAEAGDQLRTESKGTAATAEVPMAPAIGEKQPPAPPAPTIAEKAAANPNAAPTMADLASLEALIKGNQLKQPTEAPTTPAAEPEPLSPVQPAKTPAKVSQASGSAPLDTFNAMLDYFTKSKPNKGDMRGLVYAGKQAGLSEAEVIAQLATRKVAPTPILEAGNATGVDKAQMLQDLKALDNPTPDQIAARDRLQAESDALKKSAGWGGFQKPVAPTLKPSTKAAFEQEIAKGTPTPIDKKSQGKFNPNSPSLKNSPQGERSEPGEYNSRPAEVAITQTDNGISHFAEPKFQRGWKRHRFVYSVNGKGVAMLDVMEYPEQKNGDPYPHTTARPAAANIHAAYTLPEYQRKGIMQKLVLAADKHLPMPLKPDYLNTAEMRGMMKKMVEPPSPSAEQPSAPVPAEAATTAALPGQSEPLGLNRPSIRNPALEQMSDEDFDKEFRAAKNNVNSAEKLIDQVDDLDKLTPQQRKGIGAAQDRWTAADLERFRRNTRNTVPEDLFYQLKNIAPNAVKFGPESDTHQKAQIILQELQRQGATPEQMLREIKLTSPDAAEVFKADLEDIKKLASSSQSEPIQPMQISAPPTPKAKETGALSLEKVRTGSVDTPAQGSLNQALKLKADTWKRVQSIRQQIKARPLNTGNLRVDLIKAESAHREALQMERDARAGIETRANEQGQTTKPTPPAPAEKPAAAKVETPAAGESNPGSPQPESTSTISDKANRIADKIEEIFRSEGKGKLRTLPVDRIIEAGAKIAADIIRAGGKVADAIAAGVKHIRDNYKGDFDAKAFEDKIRVAHAEETPLPEGSSPANKFSAIVRDALNLPERETPERQSRESVVADAEQRMARHPALAADLVDQVTKNPRELKPWEQVVFLRHVVDLKKSLEAANEDVFQAKKDGNLADEEIAVLHAQELSDKVFAAVDAFEKSGTPSARSLQFRNTLMKEDYSTESLEMGARAARGGERLSESELAKIKEQSDEIHATQQKIDEETKAQAERDAEDASIHTHAEMVRQAEKEPWHAFSPEVYKQAQKIVDRLQSAEDAALARLRAKGIRLNIGYDPTNLSDYAIVGASRMAKFAVKSARWIDSMVETFGEEIREHLPKIAAAAEKIFNREGGDKIQKPRTKSGKPVDIIETIKATLKKIHEEIADGATPKDYANLIRSIARRAVEGGMRDRNEIVDEVHRELTEKGVEITRNEVRDAISGYGDYRQLSKAEVDVELGRVKDELRKVAQIEALEKGQAPLKSGVEHRASQDAARRMQQRINQLKKELGIVSGDPATQLKTALASKKTRLNNQIRDLEHEIATREKIVREHGQTPNDPETDALTAKRDALKKERDAIFKGEMSDEQRLALSERAAQRSLDEWNQKLADAQKGKFDLGETKRDMPASEKLKAVRDARDAAKAEVEHLKALAHPELAEQSALAAKKASLLKSIATYSDKLARGDFSTRPKAKTNPKLAALEAQKKRVFETYRAANKKATLARRPFWVKAVEAVPKFIGQAVLSSPATLVKLAAASATHVVLRPIDDMVGGALGRVPGLRGIAGDARTEGAGLSPSNYAKALAKAVTLGVADARKTLNLKATVKPIASYAKGVLTMDKAKREAAKTEFRNVSHTSDLDERFGKAGHGRDSLEFFGLLHGAEKAPLKRFVFEYNYARGVDWAERNGLDPKDPIVAMRIGLDAYKQAQRALFLEDNRATDAFNAGLGTLARPYKVDVGGKMVEKHPAIGTIGTAAIRANMPVIKVAANVMAQAFERAGGGLVMGAGRIARYGGAEAAKRGTGMSLRERFAKGLAEMPEGEADKVIGNLKRGLVGSAFMLFAFYNYQSFGGFWQQGEKRKSGEIKADEIRLGEHDVPPLLLHNPLFIAGQAAATARKVAESKLRKKDKEAQGYDDGLLAAALGIAQTTPFTREAETVSQILNPHTRQSALGRAAQMAVPQLIQAPARWMDKDASGNVIRRDPKSIWQSLETGIPGLRKNVPEKKK